MTNLLSLSVVLLSRWFVGRIALMQSGMSVLAIELKKVAMVVATRAASGAFCG